MLRVDVQPRMLVWAKERKRSEKIPLRFPRLNDWIDKRTKPTFKQLEKYAKATNTPIGYFFLNEPPKQEIPITDFRTISDKKMTTPSPDLLETIYLCQQRQDWYRDFAIINKMDPIDIVGSSDMEDDIVETAKMIRQRISFDPRDRKGYRTWEQALRKMIENIEETGILVMINGVVGNNNHRKLNVKEFRGFNLVDELAPLIFVNGSDSKSAQMFTLAHELAHIWIGKTGVSNIGAENIYINGVEKWCNRCAAEILVPLDMIERSYDRDNGIEIEMNRLAREFKVSTLVILRRIFDLGNLEPDEFQGIFNEQYSNLLEMNRGRGGGDFYRTQPARVGKRFARALISSTLEGRTLYSEAFSLMGVSKVSTFEEMGRRLEVL